MSQKKLRLTIIVLLSFAALASHGCGGGGTATGGAFNSAVMPGAGPASITKSSESENAVLDNPPPDGGGGNGTSGAAPDAQTGQEPDARNAQAEEEPAGDANQGEVGEENPAGPASTGESETASLGGSPPDGEEENGPGGTTHSPPGGENVSPPGGKSNKAPGGESKKTPGGSTKNTPLPEPSKNNPNREIVFPYGIQEEGLPLPPGHGLPPGLIKVTPGREEWGDISEEYGGIETTCPMRSGFCFIKVAADGAATYLVTELGLGLASSEPELLPRFQPSETPLPRSTDAAQAPVLDFVTSRHVGADVAPRAGELASGAGRGGVSVSHGEVRDGVGADRLLEFMHQHADLENKLAHTGIGGAPGLETFAEPPTIRLAEGTGDLYARYAAHAVQLINSALPYDRRITLGAERLPADTKLGDIPEGEILLEFDSIPGGILGDARLLSGYLVDPDTNQPLRVQNALKARVMINENEMRRSWVHRPTQENPYGWGLEYPNSRLKNSDEIIKLYNDRIFLSVVVHELMHALGLYHIDESRFSDSIMHSEINAGQANVHTPNIDGAIILLGISGLDEAANPPGIDESQGASVTLGNGEARYQPVEYLRQGYIITARARTVPGHILFPIDRAALLAAYDRLQPGAQPEDLTAENLGSWSDTSFHLRGDVDFTGGGASFGVASANGFAQPWATGPAPWTNLADNQALSGTATWSGALLGVDSSSETVAGDAALTVNLTSLTGQLDFTGLEKWGAGEAPGAAGSGTTWGDGDLGYTIEVRDNTFVQTGGDEGYVTGAFFGAAHEAMGGVLERADLAAGFGGTR